MEMIVEFDEYYKPWSGAIDTWRTIEEEDRLGDVEEVLEELLGDCPTITEINDLLWFDGDTVLQALGILTDTEIEEAEDERERLVKQYKEDIKDLLFNIEQLEIEQNGDSTIDNSSVLYDMNEELEDFETALEVLESLDLTEPADIEKLQEF